MEKRLKILCLLRSLLQLCVLYVDKTLETENLTKNKQESWLEDSNSSKKTNRCFIFNEPENRFLIKIQTTTKYYFRFIENIKHGKKFSLRQQLRNWSH